MQAFSPGVIFMVMAHCGVKTLGAKAEAHQCSAPPEGEYKTHGRLIEESMSRLDAQSAEKKHKFDFQLHDPELELRRELAVKEWSAVHRVRQTVKEEPAVPKPKADEPRNSAAEKEWSAIHAVRQILKE